MGSHSLNDNIKHFLVQVLEGSFSESIMDFRIRDSENTDSKNVYPINLIIHPASGMCGFLNAHKCQFSRFSAVPLEVT